WRRSGESRRRARRRGVRLVPTRRSAPLAVRCRAPWRLRRRRRTARSSPGGLPCVTSSKNRLTIYVCPAVYSSTCLRSSVLMVGVEMFVNEGLGHSSYLVDLGNGSAAIVDPPRFATEHLAAARRRGIRPRWT